MEKENKNSKTDNILLHIPARYIDLTKISPSIVENINNSTQGEFLFLIGKVSAISERIGKKNTTNFFLIDSLGFKLKVTLFGKLFIWKEQLFEGALIAIRGKLNEFRGETSLTGSNIYPPEKYGTVIPVYKSVKGKISSNKIETIIKENFHEATVETAYKIIEKCLLSGYVDNEKNILDRINSVFSSICDILKAVHAPSSEEQGNRAILEIKRIAALEAVISGKRVFNELPKGAQYSIPYDKEILSKFSTHIPFKLTLEQKKAVVNILKDLNRSRPTRHLLSGDVGTGKTVVLGMVAASVVSQKRNVAIMLPNANLPKQFLDELKGWWPYLNFEIVTNKTKPTIIEERPTIYIGTSSVLSKLKTLDISLFIIDEQHKFSVKQREALGEKNILEATATCIPRTQALVTFGGFGQSILKKCHVKKHIYTNIVFNYQYQSIIRKIKKTIEKGFQVIIVYSLATPTKTDTGRTSVEEGYDYFSNLFPNDVEYLHSKVSSEHRENTIRKLKNCESHICIATTTVEVGLDIKKVRYVIIVDADRFGLSQLHQLRGRAARSGGNGLCDLVIKNNVKKETIKRLQVMVESQNGFEISEKDMYLRGIGDLASDNQKGRSNTLFTNLKITPDIFDDIDLKELKPDT